MRHDEDAFRTFSLTTVWLWLSVFALLPFCLIMGVSFMRPGTSHLFALPLTVDSYRQLINPIYYQIFQKSFLIAGFATLACLLVGYPFAYIVARLQSRWKSLLLLLVIIPFWTSTLIRSYALIAMIKAKGVLNTFLLWTGLIHAPLSIMFTNYAVMIGLVYNLLPFMILPIMTNVERLDQRIVDAARDLGANSFTTFRKVIIPLTMPGIIAGSILVFLPAMTLFYIPDILGGAKSILLGNLIQSQFLISRNWPLGAASSTMLTLLLAMLILVYLWVSRGSKKQAWL